MLTEKVLLDGNPETWLWIELIGFDNEREDFAVPELLSRMTCRPTGMGLFLYTIDFINGHAGLDEERELLPECCSYGAHPYNVDRARQKWTNWQLRALIRKLHEEGVQVFLSCMGYSRFFDDTSEASGDELIKSHPELQFRARDGQPFHVLHALKSFSDGTPYADFFLEKLEKVFLEYGFDGIQVADGLSSPVRSVENGDFSDVMALPFWEWAQICPSEEISGPCDADADRFEKRAAAIWAEHRMEWIRYNAALWERFYAKITRKIHALGRRVFLNNALTMEPVEALYRYGIDYTAMKRTGADAWIVEEVSPGLSLMPENPQIFGEEDPIRERMKKRYHCSATFQFMKAACPDSRHIFMTNVRDTAEQYDVLHHAPTLWQRYLYTNLNQYLATEHGYRRVCDGLWFCLSDGLTREDWRFMRETCALAAGQKPAKMRGLTILWDEGTQWRELEQLIRTRRWTSARCAEELAFEGAQLNTIARLDGDLSALSGDLFVPNFHLLPLQKLQSLLKYQGGRVFLFGMPVAGLEKPALEIRQTDEEGDTVLWGYGCEWGREVFAAPGQSFGDPMRISEIENDGWPNRIALRACHPDFLRACADKMQGFPRITRTREHCGLIAYEEEAGSLLLFAGNDAWWYAAPEIDVGFPIGRIDTLTKYAGYSTPFSGSRLTGYVPPRGMDILRVFRKTEEPQT